MEERNPDEKKLQRLANEAQQSQEIDEEKSDIDEELMFDEEESDIDEELMFDEEESEATENYVLGINPDVGQKSLIYYNEEIGAFKASDFLEVIKVTKNLDTQKIYITLHHLSNTFDREVTINLSKLKKSSIFVTLTNQGIVIYENFAPAISHYLIEQVDFLIQQQLVKYEHERLGWIDTLSLEKGFLVAESINAPYASKMRGNDEKFLGSNGDKNKYDDMILTEVIPNKSLHLPFVLAFTSPLVPIMYDKSACPVLMINFAGKSTHGKTTSLVLMGSVWGKGIVTNERLSVIKTFVSTQNGFEAVVNNNNGVPVLFDDYEAASRSLSFGNLIYTLAQGESKIRCDKSGHTLDTHRWRTTIALAGESSIFDKAEKKQGLKPRIVEFKNKMWTVSKKNSISITSIVEKNYGFYGPLFVQGLCGLTKEQLDAYYDDSNTVIESRLPSTDNISDRIQTRLVLIRMTAVLVREIMDLDIDVDYITDFIVNNEINRQSEIDIYQQAKEKLVEYTIANLTRFVRNDSYAQPVIPNNKIDGRIYSGDRGYFVAIMPETFKRIIADFNDKDAILEKWRDEGFLVTDSDKKRFTKKVKVTQLTQATRCYVFLFDSDDKLSDYLNGNETIFPQQLVEQERNERLNKLSHPKTINHNGMQYQLMVPINDNKEVDANTIHDQLEGQKINSLDSPIKEAPVSDTSYDDENEIDKIFEEDSDND